VAKMPGTEPTIGKSMMFNGHLDIDPITENFGMNPWDIRLEGNKLWGHGLRNMKAGVASMTIAANAIKKSGVKLRGDLYVVGVVGELQGGIGTKALLDERFIKLTDYAIVPEPSYLKIRTVVAGIIDMLIHVKGISEWIGGMHARRNVNAIEKACKVISALQQMKFTYKPRTDLPHLPKWNVGNIIGGLTKEYKLWRPGYVPDYCTITYEVRTLPNQTFEEVLQDVSASMRKLMEEDPDLDIEVETGPSVYREPWKGHKHCMPSAEIDANSDIVQALAKNHKAIIRKDPHIGPENPGSYAGNDMGHLVNAGIKAITYGPTDQVQPPNHFVEVDKLMNHARVVALTTYDLCS
jgi:acetylornithine deacetylase